MNKKKVNNFSRIISKITVLCLVLSSVLVLSGCEEYKSDETLRREKIDLIIDSLDNRDPQKIKSLFAPNAIIEIPNLDESINDLLVYYQGSYVSRTWEAAITTNSADHGVTTKEYDLSFDITTTDDVYRVAFPQYRVKDTGDKNNIGIWQFFIIRFEDDPNSKNGYYYWGDWREEAGLIIGAFRIIEEPTEEVEELETYE